jgi:hypothetical protein
VSVRTIELSVRLVAITSSLGASVIETGTVVFADAPVGVFDALFAPEQPATTSADAPRTAADFPAMA